MQVRGECFCGEVTFEAELDPTRVGLCHCIDCQKVSGGAFRMIAIVDAAGFKITKGTPATFIKTAESGNRRVQAFCGTCASALYACADVDNPPNYNLRVGVLDRREDLTPHFEAWRQSALDWVKIDGAHRQFNKGPS